MSESEHQSFDWAVSHDPLIVPLLVNLKRASKVVQARSRSVWDRHGLTTAEFDVLATLRSAPSPHELTPGQIRERVLVTSGGLTKVTQLLEQKGYVQRFVAPDDNRSKPVRLTATGRALSEQVMGEMMARHSPWAHGLLDEQEIRLATQVLGKLADAA